MSEFGAISEKKIASLKEKMKEFSVTEDQFEERFLTCGGKGGQKINKTSAAVQLKHLPTGLCVKVSRERQRSHNRFLARRLLMEKIEEKQTGRVSSRQTAIEKIRKQKKRRSRRSKRRADDNDKV